MTRLPITHNELKAQIVEYLTRRRWLAWPNNSGAFPVEDATHRRRYVRFGKKGSADIFAIRPCDGKFHSIEVKVGRDQLRDDQRQWMDDVQAHGGVAIVARQLEDVIALVERAPRRTK